MYRHTKSFDLGTTANSPSIVKLNKDKKKTAKEIKENPSKRMEFNECVGFPEKKEWVNSEENRNKNGKDLVTTYASPAQSTIGEYKEATK